MIGIVILTSVALILSIILVCVSNKLEDNNSKEIMNYLPGANCGACGLNCADLAEQITKDPSVYVKCRVLRGDNLEKFKLYLKEKYNI